MQSPTADLEATADAVAVVRGFHERLRDLGAGLDDAGRIDLIRALEELKASAAAEQARVTVAFDASQRQTQADAGVPAERRGRGIAQQIALARRVSAHRGAREVGLAKALVNEMPHTLDRLTAGGLSEWRATLLARETATLTAEHRREVDRQVCGDPKRLEGLGDRKLVDATRRIGHRLDPGAAVRRSRKAESDRRVTSRPAPDTMAWVSALLPVAQGVAVIAALKRYADSRVAAGDPRTRGQLMADALVERITGQATAEDVPVGVNLLIPAESLFSGDHEPGHVDGYGPVPAGWARDLVRTALERLGPQAAGWLRRALFDEVTGNIVTMDSRSRSFPDGLDLLIAARDAGICRNSWCDAPARHTDHITRHADGGATSADNGQGLCQACNDAKEAPGWTTETTPGDRHTVTTTPTGHCYTSTAPAPPGTHANPYPLDLYWPRAA
jgi:hypothetical protein